MIALGKLKEKDRLIETLSCKCTVEDKKKFVKICKKEKVGYTKVLRELMREFLNSKMNL